jgi:hypothetical protein
VHVILRWPSVLCASTTAHAFRHLLAAAGACLCFGLHTHAHTIWRCLRAASQVAVADWDVEEVEVCVADFIEACCMCACTDYVVLFKHCL